MLLDRCCNIHIFFLLEKLTFLQKGEKASLIFAINDLSTTWGVFENSAYLQQLTTAELSSINNNSDYLPFIEQVYHTNRLHPYLKI